jgi:anti-sigma B factor antagonist
MAPSEKHSSRHFGLRDGVFEIHTGRLGDQLRLGLSGELDLASADELDEAIQVAEEGPARAIVLDLTDLQFIDSTGLQVLLKAHARSKENGRRLRFAPSSHEAVRQLIAVTGTGEIFD